MRPDYSTLGFVLNVLYIWKRLKHADISYTKQKTCSQTWPQKPVKDCGDTVLYLYYVRILMQHECSLHPSLWFKCRHCWMSNTCVEEPIGNYTVISSFNFKHLLTEDKHKLRNRIVSEIDTLCQEQCWSALDATSVIWYICREHKTTHLYVLTMYTSTISWYHTLSISLWYILYIIITP